MPTSIDAVAAPATGRLLPVESTQSQRNAQDEHAGLERRTPPAAAFQSREEGGANAYAPPRDIVATGSFVTPDAVAPALAEALAAEPWGHPMPEKAVWEQAAAARERAVSATTIVAATPAPAAPAAAAEPAPATPVVTTAAAPATQAAAVTSGAATPVPPAWLTSLRKAR